MTDIIDQLRDSGSALGSAAANEIERLRTQVAANEIEMLRALADDLGTAIHDYLADEYGESEDGQLLFPPAGVELAAAWARWREARDHGAG